MESSQNKSVSLEKIPAAAFASPVKECDLIMEGGISSGVVYPRSLVRLATRYRFRSIGGTSAGAIAAAIAAAAEYGRASGAFVKLQDLPDLLAGILLSLFQPVPTMRGVFDAFLAIASDEPLWRRITRAVGSLLRSHWIAVLMGLLITALYVWATRGADLPAARVVFGVLVGLVSIALSVLLAVVFGLKRELPKHGFGVCPGLSQPHFKSPALTEWLTEYLDFMAGKPPADTPNHLTFGDLEERGIHLKMMTTNLSMLRPYSLPFQSTQQTSDPESERAGESEFAFHQDEWSRLFPASVVQQSSKHPVPGKSGYFYLPQPADLPVVVAVRMSLSFPVLLATVSLYRKDRTLRAEPEQIDELQRCVFSDGGICSDFPIHFFDSLLPTRPTFAISLGKYDRRRNGANEPQNRVYMFRKAGGGIQLPILPITSVGAFAATILNSARVWQDTLQALLSGCRERIAHIALDSEEGGLHLNMSAERVGNLALYGDIAGQKMLDFEFDEHRWRRYLVSFGALYRELLHVHQAYDPDFQEFLQKYPDLAQSYRQTQTWMNNARAFLNALDRLVDQQPGNLSDGQVVPRPRATLRVMADP